MTQPDDNVPDVIGVYHLERVGKLDATNGTRENGRYCGRGSGVAEMNGKTYGVRTRISQYMTNVRTAQWRREKQHL